ncbi:MAG: hypothetical protein JXA01_05800 [Dehalococcoidia bacterium]|nr:hypothetical protein [Dehalococcoidia bacterium]
MPGPKVEYICEAGFGSEARCDLELRREFPGIGGTIFTYQSLPVARRTEFNNSRNSVHRMFLKHAVIKKLEDYFFRLGEYGYAHITRPLGSTDQSYIYEWAFGEGSFPWEYSEYGDGRTPVDLQEWDHFLAVFNNAGIDLSVDCTDPDNGLISKNIIHQMFRPYKKDSKLNCMWKRIDFGESSIRIDYNRLSRFLEANCSSICMLLTAQRFEFLNLSCKYLLCKCNEREIGKLEQLTLDYRMSTLSHLNTIGVEAAPQVQLLISLAGCSF